MRINIIPRIAMAVQSRRAAIIVDRVLDPAAVCCRTCERRNDGLGVIDIGWLISSTLCPVSSALPVPTVGELPHRRATQCRCCCVHPAGGQHKAEHHQQHEHGSARSRNLRRSVRQIVFRRMLLFFYGFHGLNGAGPSSRRPKYCSIACTIRCEVFPSPYGLTACAIFS